LWFNVKPLGLIKESDYKTKGIILNPRDEYYKTKGLILKTLGINIINPWINKPNVFLIL